MEIASIQYETPFVRGTFMKKLSTLAIFTCLILGFQNCSQSGLSTGGSADSAFKGDSSGDAELDPSSLSEVSTVEIPYSTNSIAVNDSGEGLREARKSGSVSNDRLVVDLASGKISLLNAQGQAVAETCLDDSRLEEMKSYLSSSSICEAEVESNVACTQVYEQGYASLASEAGRLNLGESLDGCGRGYKDFCGSVASSFKGLVESIKQNWQQLSCQ